MSILFSLFLEKNSQSFEKVQKSKKLVLMSLKRMASKSPETFKRLKGHGEVGTDQLIAEVCQKIVNEDSSKKMEKLALAELMLIEQPVLKSSKIGRKKSGPEFVLRLYHARKRIHLSWLRYTDKYSNRDNEIFYLLQAGPEKEAFELVAEILFVDLGHPVVVREAWRIITSPDGAKKTVIQKFEDLWRTNILDLFAKKFSSGDLDVRFLKGINDLPKQGRDLALSFVLQRLEGLDERPPASSINQIPPVLAMNKGLKRHPWGSKTATRGLERWFQQVTRD